jgi:hypothetical protein
MGGVANFCVLAFERNLRKRIGCGFVFGNSLTNTKYCGRTGTSPKSSCS